MSICRGCAVCGVCRVSVGCVKESVVLADLLSGELIVEDGLHLGIVRRFGDGCV